MNSFFIFDTKQSKKIMLFCFYKMHLEIETDTGSSRINPDDHINFNAWIDPENEIDDSWIFEWSFPSQNVP